MKNLFLFVLALILILAFFGCGEKRPDTIDPPDNLDDIPPDELDYDLPPGEPTPEPTPPPEATMQPIEETDYIIIPDLPPSPPGKSSGFLTLLTWTDKEEFSKDEPITIKLAITNSSNGYAGIVVGSSANPVPDSVKITAPTLAYMTPSVVTDDYGVKVFAPKDTTEYTATFAPYSGPITDIKTPVTDLAGKPGYLPAVGQHTITFELTYSDLIGQNLEDAFSAIDQGEKVVLTQKMTITIK